LSAVRLRVDVADGGLCHFSYALGAAGWNTLPEPFQAQAGVWIGARVGLFAATQQTSAAGHADFKTFQFLPPG